MLKSVLNENLNVIFCVGETAKEKKEGKTLSVLYNQLRKSIDKRFDFITVRMKLPYNLKPFKNFKESV